MYNGIGLATARGSGTNAYVQRNLSQVRKVKEKVGYKTDKEIEQADARLDKRPNAEILLHDKKRRVELKCMELQSVMEEQGYSDGEIEKKVSVFRKMLIEKEENIPGKEDATGRPIATETHQIAEMKEQENQKLRDAFGISSSYVKGSAFDPEARKLQREREMEEKKLRKQQRYALVRSPSHSPPPMKRSGKAKNKSKKRKKKRSSSSEDSEDEIKEKKKRRKRRTSFSTEGGGKKSNTKSIKKPSDHSQSSDEDKKRLPKSVKDRRDTAEDENSSKRQHRSRSSRNRSEERSSKRHSDGKYPKHKCEDVSRTYDKDTEGSRHNDQDGRHHSERSKYDQIKNRDGASHSYHDRGENETGRHRNSDSKKRQRSPTERDTVPDTNRRTKEKKASSSHRYDDRHHRTGGSPDIRNRSKEALDENSGKRSDRSLKPQETGTRSPRHDDRNSRKESRTGDGSRSDIKKTPCGYSREENNEYKTNKRLHERSQSPDIPIKQKSRREKSESAERDRKPAPTERRKRQEERSSSTPEKSKTRKVSSLRERDEDASEDRRKKERKAIAELPSPSDNPPSSSDEDTPIRQTIPSKVTLIHKRQPSPETDSPTESDDDAGKNHARTKPLAQKNRHDSSSSDESASSSTSSSSSSGSSSSSSEDSSSSSSEGETPPRNKTH